MALTMHWLWRSPVRFLTCYMCLKPSDLVDVITMTWLTRFLDFCGLSALVSERWNIIHRKRIFYHVISLNVNTRQACICKVPKEMYFYVENIWKRLHVIRFWNWVYISFERSCEGLITRVLERNKVHKVTLEGIKDS